MGTDSILKKNVFWIIMGGLCSIVITCSIVAGTNVVTEQMDALLMNDTVNMTKVSFIVLPLILIAAFVSFVKSKCIGKYSVEVIKDLHNKMIRHLLNVDNAFFEQESNGKLLARMTSDINEVENFTSTTLPGIITAIISIVTTAVYVGCKNVYMLLIPGILYPLIIYIMTFWGNILKRLAQKRKGNIDEMLEQVVDGISGIEVIKSYNLYQVFVSKIESAIHVILENEYKRAWIMHFSQTVQRFLFCIPNMICPVVSLVLVLDSKITVGEMTAYIVLINKIISSMKQMPALISDFKEKSVSIERLN